jgi:hypothetical protein
VVSEALIDLRKEFGVNFQYRFEIECVLPEEKAMALVRRASRSYRGRGGARTVRRGHVGLIPATKFIPDTEDALLELIEAALAAAIPECEPTAFRCTAIAKQPG